MSRDTRTDTGHPMTTPTVLIDDPDFQIVDVRGQHTGAISMIERTSGVMCYKVEYRPSPIDLGRQATQIEVWRDSASAFVSGITQTIFDELLLPRFCTITNSSSQTGDVGRLWLSQMAYAAYRGRRVGFGDVTRREIDWCPPDADVRLWLRSCFEWRHDQDRRGKRYVISLD